MEFNFQIKRTNDCSQDEIANFFDLAKKAEQVDTIGLRRRIENSKLLAFCYYKNLLIGISAIKIPNIDYKHRIFAKAEIENEADNFNFELGYSFTEEKYRGKQINYNLNQRLIKESQNTSIYATTANFGMRKILKKIGFSEIGKTYKGEHNTDNIQIFGFR